ncbi:glycosyltransferase family 4 protein [bacterium]|nr:glycosyltransferase family 4 protein [bacterium]
MFNGKIIIHINTSSELRGGERQTKYLAEGLEKRGWRNYIIVRPKNQLQDFIDIPPDRFLEIPMSSELDISSGWRIGRMADNFGAKIIHCHTAHAHSMGLLAKFFSKSKPKVIITRRVDFLPQSGFFSKWKYRQADHTIAISSRIEDILKKSGVDPQKISLAPSGVRFELNEKKEDKIKQEIGIPANCRVIGTIAALADHKDYPTLINAFKIIIDKYPNTILLMLGEGGERKRIEKLIADLSLQDRTRLLGFRNDAPRFFNIFDIYVQSSKLEGLCSSLIEAMYHRLPIAASAAGGIPDLIEHEINGLLVEPQNPEKLAVAIIRLIEDKELAEKLGESAHEKSLKFTDDKMVEGTEAVYLKILNSE